VAYIREYGLLEEHPTAGEAWTIVLDEIRRVGGNYGAPAIKNELIQKAVDAVGWKEICLSERPDIIRAHFTKAYEALVEKRKREVMSA
jgi:hypothetical protein